MTGEPSPASAGVPGANRARGTNPDRGARPPNPPHRRRRLLAIAGVLALLLSLDLVRSPEHQLSARALLGAIDWYQATLSPTLGKAGVRCRFRPSCSHYAEGAIRKHGALGGTLRTAWRIARCGPWTEAGTYDPP